MNVQFFIDAFKKKNIYRPDHAQLVMPGSSTLHLKKNLSHILLLLDLHTFIHVHLPRY
jgi:hypothetical protein